MCGIAGVWGAGATRLEALDTVGRMTDRLAHRGPDAGDLWSGRDDEPVLGHRRLAVVALGPEGAQPMESRSGRWVITYNGELYGADAVAARLEGLGTTLRGRSDTEVLVEALDTWGPADALRAVDGMFAFAAWDREERRLVLARDRMGEKPLAYAPCRGGLAFASELSALRLVDGVDTSIDPAAVAAFLRFKYVPTPLTIHPGARKVPPGCWVEVRGGGAQVGDPTPYWSYVDVVTQGRADPVAAGDALDALDEVLRGAATRQLRADVPLGAFLSGGIDSSLVSALAAEAVDEPLRTFTIGSPDADLDETDAARAIASHLGTRHTELEVGPADAVAEIPDLAATWDEPFGDSSQLPTLLVARLARRDVTVALSGDGGDELFGGYNRHVWLPGAWDRIGRIPAPARRGAARVLGAASPAAWDRAARVVPERRRPRLVGLKVQKVAGIIDAADGPDAYGRLTSHWQDPGRIVGVEEPVTLVHDRGRWPRGLGLAESMMAVDALTYLPDDVLVKVDRATMAVSLEARVPLLDRQVVEMAARLPLEVKVRDGVGKWALRQLLGRRVPTRLFERPKSGFGIPIASWLRGELRPWAEDLLSPRALAGAGLADVAPIRSAWAEHTAGVADRSYELWDVLMLQSWLAATSGSVRDHGRADRAK